VFDYASTERREDTKSPGGGKQEKNLGEGRGGEGIGGVKGGTSEVGSAKMRTKVVQHAKAREASKSAKDNPLKEAKRPGWEGNHRFGAAFSRYMNNS